ncbi:MAG: 6-phosphogluconolactonase [Terriglobales bacterium]
MAASPAIRVFRDKAELFNAAADEIARIANSAVQSNGKFSIALSGGSSPKGLFTLLAGGNVPPIPWDKTYFFWGDERHVPPDNFESNYRMAKETLLDKLAGPESHIFRVHSEETADKAASDYEQTIKEFFKLSLGEFPRFDLILLGIGPDGHTASLFPGTTALKENNRLVVSNWVDKLKTERITMTYPVLNNAAAVMFLVIGADKAPAVSKVFEDSSSELPSQKVRPTSGKLMWMLDEPAASALSPQLKSN